ncbi:3'-5' exonuclease [soil metagenome]
MTFPERLLSTPPMLRPFVAIDFETADYRADSACAMGLVRVEGLNIVERKVVLIRPPRSWIHFTHIHGLTWEMVKDAPRFADAWQQVKHLLDGVDMLAAHNAGFDRGVLNGCCRAAGFEPPSLPFLCTVKLAKRTWKEKRNNLAIVCERLGIALNHHEALSDAEACARIAIAASKRVQPVLPLFQ